MLAGRMRVSSTTSSLPDSGADTLAIGVFDGETVAHDVKGDALQRLIDAGEARTAFRHVSVAHAADRRWLIVGLGPRSQFTPERARIAAATALGRAQEVGTLRLCWELPHHDVSAPVSAAAVLAEAANGARDLQNTPANELTPAALGEAAAALEGVAVEVHGRDFPLERGMGAVAA